MKRMITVLATALLASSLLAGAADARGGGGGGGVVAVVTAEVLAAAIWAAAELTSEALAGEASAAEVLAAARISAASVPANTWEAPVAALAAATSVGDHIGDGRIGAHGFGLHHHALNRFGGFEPPDCYDWYSLHPGLPLPLSCS